MGRNGRSGLTRNREHLRFLNGIVDTPDRFFVFESHQ